MPGCKHTIENEKLKEILDDKIVGIPQCPYCSNPITYLPRFKEKFKSRKKDVVQVFDHYFILKSNLNKTKQILLEDFDLELCDDKFKNHVSTRCQDKSNPMTLAGKVFQIYYRNYVNLKGLKGSYDKIFNGR